LGVSPGDTSEVFGHDENSDNLPGDEHGEYLDRPRLGVDPGGTGEVLGQMKAPTTCLEIGKEE